MKKLKNKFIIGVICIISVIVFSQVYRAYSNANIDTNSYLTLVKGNGTLNESQLALQDKYILQSGDKIRIIGKSSLGVIQWGDGSLTRLGGNTKISIEQNQISRDYTNINISFDLISGRTWSQVVSFIGKDSSFTQSFDGLEAGVRGTVFNVDLNKDFINVSDHQVSLRNNSGEVLLIKEGEPFQISTLSPLNIQAFLDTIQDVNWVKLNESFDEKYIQELKKKLSESIESSNPFLFLLDFISPSYRILYELDTAQDYKNIETLLKKVSKKDKQSIYLTILSKYQSMNFVSANDYEFYKRKIFYKKALLYLAPTDEDKEYFLKSTSYDLQDILQSGKTEAMEEIATLFKENKKLLQGIDTSFINEELEKIPVDLGNEFQKSFEGITDIFDFTISDTALKDIGENIKDGLDSVDDSVQDFLNKNVGGFIKKNSN